LRAKSDRSALFIKLSRNCGSALEQTSSDSRSTGVLRFGVFHACFLIKRFVFLAAFCSACRPWRRLVAMSMLRPNGSIWTQVSLAYQSIGRTSDPALLLVMGLGRAVDSLARRGGGRVVSAGLSGDSL
jgi:hypothetical protein